jgi:hypothetical protein
MKIKLSFLALIIALILAFFAQHLFSKGGRYHRALLLYGLAVVVTWVYARLERGGSSFHIGGFVPLRLAFGASAFLSLALCLALESKGIFYAGQAFCWIVGMILLVAACLPHQFHWRNLAFWRKVNKSEIALVTSIVIVGFVLRAYGLDFIPSGFHGDEGELGDYALSILEGRSVPLFSTGWDRHPTLFSHLQAISMTLFGTNVFGVRILSAVTGSLTLPLVYLLARRMFGRWAATMAALLLAVSHWHIHFSRLALDDIQVSFFSTLSILFLYRGTESKRELDYCLSGLSLGLCFYFGDKALFLPPIIVLSLLYMVITKRGFLRRQYRNLAVLAASALLAFAPLGLYYLRHGWQNFLPARIKARSISNNLDRAYAIYGTRELWDVLRIQIERTLLVFHFYNDASCFYSFTHEPILDHLTAPLYLLGLAYCLYRWREAKYALLLIWYAIPISGNFLSIDPPQAHRLVTMMPVPFILAAIPLERLRQEISSFQIPLAARWRGLCSALILVIFLGLVTYKNVEAYFFRYPERCPWANVTEVARYIRRLGDSYRIYLLSAPHFYIKYGTIRFIAHNVRGKDAANVTDIVPIREKVEKDVAFIIMPSHSQMLPFIRHHYPDGVLTRYEDVRGNLLFISYLVGKEEINRHSLAFDSKANGLLGSYYPNPDWSGEAALQRIDPLIAFRRLYQPKEAPFSVKWQGRIRISLPGRYIFQTFSNGEVWLYIDGKLILRDEQVQGERWQRGEVELTVGEHDIEILYRYLAGWRVMELYWTPPDGRMELVPTEALISSTL